MEKINKQQLSALEKQLDRLFDVLNIDVEFTRHFIDRMNDTRNGKQITISELKKLFQQLFTYHGKKLSKVNRDNFEAVVNDISNDINIPFVLKPDFDNQEIDLISKTVMRKKGFKTRNKRFIVGFREFVEKRENHK